MSNFVHRAAMRAEFKIGGEILEPGSRLLLAVVVFVEVVRFLFPDIARQVLLLLLVVPDGHVFLASVAAKACRVERFAAGGWGEGIALRFPY